MAKRVSATKHHEVDISVQTQKVEVMATRTVYRGCPDCHTPHPHALGLETTKCSGCNRERGEAVFTESTPAVVTGVQGFLGHSCLNFANWLKSLAKRLL
jgi:hypothetical protein